MFNLFRFFFAVLVILLIVPQTPTENNLLREFNNTGLFTNYGEAKWFLNFITRFSIFMFLVITLIAALG